MRIEAIVCVFTALLGLDLAAEPTVNCPVPVSPLNGQVRLSASGTMVTYACDPGYKLTGPRYANCKNNVWQPVPPTCQPREAISMPAEEENDGVLKPLRPLFKWDDDNETSVKINKTEEDLQGDEARLHMILYPERQYFTRRVQRVRSGSELEEEEQKRSKSGKSTTDQVETPGVVYVRRPVSPSKLTAQERAWMRQYNRAALRLVGPDNQVVQIPRSGDKNVQSEDALRHMYWMAQYMHPRQAAMMVHASAAGYPVVTTLTESQMAWINSLHPELRDRYLKDLYGMRAKEVEEGARAQAFLRRYDDVTNWLYHNPYYYRQPLSVMVEDPVTAFDYSCYQTEDDGTVTMIRAPSLPNAYLHRYDRRSNPNYPRNDYLAAEYKCNPGYTLVDYRFHELYCSQKGWVGTLPACVPKE